MPGFCCKFNEHLLCLFLNWLRSQFWNTSGRSPSVTFSRNRIRGERGGGKHSVKHHLWLSIIVPSLKTAFDSKLSSLPSCSAQTLNLALQDTLGRARRFEWLRDTMVHSPVSWDQHFSPILLSENNLLGHSDRNIAFLKLEIHWGWWRFGWFVSTAVDS